MRIRQRCPAEREVPLEALLAELDARPRRAPAPFSPEATAFCDGLSRELFQSPASRAFPEVQALAFWLRSSEIQRLKSRFEAIAGDGALLAPRGLVFHVPPGNVGTMFAYSWVFALLAGNASVIRLPSAEQPAIEAVLAAVNALLRREEFAGVARGLWVVSYGHEEEITAALSMKADLRVIWGGDETVRRLRGFPIPPRARDLSFPDRYSLCAVKAGPYLALGPGERRSLAEAFFNDAYWFGQQACSSPRLVVWCGAPREAREASRAFFEALDAAVAARGVSLDAASALQKLSFTYAAAIDRPLSAHRSFGNELTVLSLSSLEGFSRRHCGAGLFFEADLPSLDDLAGLLTGEDQTLTYFGFAKEEVEAFARGLGGRGLNRIVPIGAALQFHRYWDGYDLLQEMVQRVHVQ